MEKNKFDKKNNRLFINDSILRINYCTCGKKVNFKTTKTRKDEIIEQIGELEKELTQLSEVKLEPIDELKLQTYRNLNIENRCFCCDKEVATELHHIQPKYQNSIVQEVLVPLCKNCHLGIHSYYLSDKKLKKDVERIYGIKKEFKKNLDAWFLNNLLLIYIESLERFKNSECLLKR